MIRYIFCLITVLFSSFVFARPIRSQIGCNSLSYGKENTPSRQYWGLCFIAAEPQVTINMVKTGSAPVVSLETSFDGKHWDTFDADSESTPLLLENVGDFVYFRSGKNGNSCLSSTSAYRSFTLNKRAYASGNIMSLLNATDESNDVIPNVAGCFYRLFYNCTTLLSTPLLPATTLRNSCYMYMFAGCTALDTAAPLPATVLPYACYKNMFEKCTSLVEAPSLPDQNIILQAGEQFNNMFKECTSLVNIPRILPSTTLNPNCYNGMFCGCTSITNIPILPAKISSPGCYADMFNGCTSLIAIKNGEFNLNSMTSQCCARMFRNCSSLEIFDSLLSSVELASQCYLYMFANTRLKKAPKLSAINLVSGCYTAMFQECSYLGEIEVCFTNSNYLTTAYCNSWLDRVKSVGEFRCSSLLGT